MLFNQFTKTAIDAALTSGKILEKYFNSDIKVHYKGLTNPVTEADKFSQETIYKIIRKKFPGHTTLGEEDKKKSLCNDFCWIIDPLDGTVNFIHNVPIFCVSIALKHNDKIVSGVIHSPLLKETFVAERGKGAYFNGRKIHVSKATKLIRALAVTGFPYDSYSDPKKFSNTFARVLSEVQGLRRLGAAALDLAYVALGRFEVFWEEGLAPWDVAAGSLIVDEAGGKVSDFENRKNYLFGKSILATNGKLHKSMLKLLDIS